MQFLQVSNLNKQGESGHVLRDIHFTQEKSQKIAIAGETGSGKSTLLKIIAGLVQPTSGKVLFGNKKVTGPDYNLIPGHPGIAYLSQYFELPKFLKVAQVLQYANMLTGQEAENIYGICHINHLVQRRTDELSGGEKQRTALARLLIGSPKLLLLDEPFSNLDMIHKNLLKTVVHEIGEQLGITCTIISHDPLDTLPWADKIVVMQAGQVVQQAAPQQVYTQPVDAYVAGLFGKYTLLTQEQSHLFYGPGEAKGGSDFIRPENFKLLPKEGATATGEVNKVDYYGSYCEIELLVAGSPVMVRVGECRAVKGDIVGVGI